MSSGNNHSQSHKVQTRLLLALWDLAGMENKVTQGKLNKRAKGKKESTAVYDEVYQQLENEGAIAVVKVKGTKYVSLTEQGLQILGEGLKSSDFSFPGTIIGTWVANALLKWIRQTNNATEVTSVLGNGKVSDAIASYDEFKRIALDVYDNLNQNYNLDNLVPIYEIRRKIAESTSREHFNEWMLEMQKNDIIQLIGGEMTDISQDKLEDSITTKLSGLRFYAKRLNSNN